MVGPAASTLPDGREVLLRPVAVSDAAGMADFFASLGESETYYFFALGEAEAGRLALKADEALAFRLVAVGDLGGGAAVLGYAFLEWRDEGPPEFGVCLRPGSQSGGLGRVLMDHLFTSARASGVRRVYLTVHPENARALLLYQRFGFVLVGEFVNDHQGVKQYRMELDLGSHPPSLAEDVVVVAQGGVGIAGAAFRVQGALEALLGATAFGWPASRGRGGRVRNGQRPVGRPGRLPELAPAPLPETGRRGVDRRPRPPPVADMRAERRRRRPRRRSLRDAAG